MKKYIYIIFLFVLFPLSISAQELELSLECPKEIQKNEEFRCTLKGSTKHSISAIEYEFEVPDNIEYNKFEKDSTWEGDEENHLILLYTDENKTGTFSIGEMYFITNKDIDEVKLSTSYLLFCDEDFNDHIVVKKEENVKKVKRNEEKKINKISNILLYAIILLIIGVITFLVFRRRKNK